MGDSANEVSNVIKLFTVGQTYWCECSNRYRLFDVVSTHDMNSLGVHVSSDYILASGSEVRGIWCRTGARICCRVENEKKDEEKGSGFAGRKKRVCVGVGGRDRCLLAWNCCTFFVRIKKGNREECRILMMLEVVGTVVNCSTTNYKVVCE